MVVYYHTNSYIYAVANGYCSDVLQPDGTTSVAAHLAGHALTGGVRIPAFAAVIPVEDLARGDSLRFDMGSATLLTEPVLFIEHAASLSMPPRPHSLPPPSLPPPSSEVLRVPRLPDIPVSMRPPASQK